MEALWKKLNFKGQTLIAVLNAPAEFEEALNYIQKHTVLHQQVSGATTYPFCLAFAKMQEDIPALFDAIKNHLEEDPILWIVYPKKSSKNYQSDIGRDADAWQVLGNAGFEGVRMVAIDQDWSALRFRDVDYIKTMKRDQKRAISKKGQERTKE